MELVEVLLIGFAICVAGIVAFRLIGAMENVRLAKSRKEAQIAAQNRINAQQKRKPDIRFERPEEAPPATADVGEWLPELLDGFGIDPEVIYEEEMPEDLKSVLPLVKGYVTAQGGLGGIAGKLRGGSPVDQQRPGTGSGGI